MLESKIKQPEPTNVTKRLCRQWEEKSVSLGCCLLTQNRAAPAGRRTAVWLTQRAGASWLRPESVQTGRCSGDCSSDSSSWEQIYRTLAGTAVFLSSCAPVKYLSCCWVQWPPVMWPHVKHGRLLLSSSSHSPTDRNHFQTTRATFNLIENSCWLQLWCPTVYILCVCVGCVCVCAHVCVCGVCVCVCDV